MASARPVRDQPSAQRPDRGVDPDAVLRSSRALLGVVAHSLAPALDEVSLPQFRVLVLLSSAPAPTRSGELAAALGVHPSTFTRTADRLVVGGWVSRVENPGSRRETFVELTPAGRRLVALVTRRRRDEIARILDRLEPAERQRVIEAFDAFAHAAGEPDVGDLSSLGM